jgi:hypothetical protein
MPRIGAALLISALGVWLAGCSSGKPGATDTTGTTGTPGTPGQSTASGVVLDEDFASAGAQVFSTGNWWNVRVDGDDVPLENPSEATAYGIAANLGLHPDFGPRDVGGIPYVGVSGSQALRGVEFVAWPGESDAGAPGRPEGYPIPDEAFRLAGFVEGGVAGGGTRGDRHLLVIDRDNWLLFETGGTQWNPDLQRWEANCGGVFDLKASERRPEGWTSTDAAGLAIFPGLVRYDEVYGSNAEIKHAFRFTVDGVSGHVWPASHDAPTGGALPLGARLRLKKLVNGQDPAMRTGDPSMRRIFVAMQRYGLILADTGSDMYITGTMDDRWDNDILNPAFNLLRTSDFEVVQLGWGEP